MIVEAIRGRLYYGWVIVFALSLTQLTSWGILYYAFSVIAPAMQADLGWSQVTITGAFSLALLLSGIAAIPVGRWVDEYGTRAVMTIGSCLAVILVLLWARVTTVIGFYALWAGIGIVTACVFYEPAFTAIAVWFRQQRSRALVMLTFFGGLASLVYIPLTGWLVSGYGWRTALTILAGVLGLVTIAPHALLLRRSPTDLGLLPDGTTSPSSDMASVSYEGGMTVKEALRGMTFWWMTVAFSLTTLSSVSFTVHLIPYLTQQGYGAGFAALATGSFGAMSVSGRLLSISFGRRLSQQALAALLFLVQGLGLIVLLLGSGAGSVWCAVALFGAGSGALTPARAGLMADYYGARSYGRINGALAFLTTWARAIAPVGAGVIAAYIGYRSLWWTLAVLTFLGGYAIMASHKSHTTRAFL